MNTTTAELNLNFSKFQLYMLHLKREFGKSSEKHDRVPSQASSLSFSEG